MPVTLKRPPQPAPAQTLTRPAPVGGLNARDSIAAMPPLDAVTLDNFFPGTTSVDLRNGYETWSTGYPAAVESLMTWNGPTSSKLFAASGTAFYDATAKAAVGAAVVTGLSNARWQHANMGTPGGQFLYAVNGVDFPELYNGTAWAQVTAVSTIAITGVDPKLLIHVNLYANRLFFVEKNSSRFWYLPVNSVGGAALSFDLAPLFTLGGYLMAMATWTIDNAGGVNEYAIFISSEGEIVMYSGTDPATAANWVKNGRYRIGRPVGRRCYVRVSSDVILLTSDGFIPMSKAILTDRSQQDAISDKIQDLVSLDLMNYASNFGWSATLSPVGNKLIVNVPQIVNKVQYQYVMNSITGAWCRFTGWNANTFEMLGNDLFFGSNLQGTTPNSAYVARCDVGFSDNGGFIFGDAKSAFDYFGALGHQKQITMARPILQTNGQIQIAIAMDMDFTDSNPTAIPSFNGTAGTLWGTGLWNTFPWFIGGAIKKDWQGVTGVGDAGAFHMKVVNNKSAFKWQAVQYVYRVGGIL